jgi:chaperonin GroEL
MLERVAGILLTKDGATSIREISLSNLAENTGAQLLKDPCLKMSKEVGDGTTTTAILTAELLRESEKLLVAGCSPIDIAAGIRAAQDSALEVIGELAWKISRPEEIQAVARVSSNGDEEISQLLSEAVMAVGKTGTISVEDGKTTKTELLLRDGTEVDTRIPHHFMCPEEYHFDQPLIALFDFRLSTFRDIHSVVETASQWPYPLVIVAHAIETEALATWVVNQGEEEKPSWIGLIAPGRGLDKRPLLDDLAALSGAVVVDELVGNHTDFDPEWFGSVQTMAVKKKQSLWCAYEEGEERIQQRIAALMREEEKSSSTYDKDRIQERISKLEESFCVLRVGGVTEPEIKERRARVEDALESLRSALQDGIVPGAGTAYLFAANWLRAQGQELGDFGYGQECLRRALQAPFRILARNAGREAGPLIEQIEEAAPHDSWVGWDPNIRNLRPLYEDPMIVDSVRVAKEALRYAVSTVCTVLKTGDVVVGKR